MIVDKKAVSTVFNILSVPKNGFRFNMQLVDTLDPGLDPNLQSKDEPRMGVHLAVGVSLDDAFVLLEENALSSALPILSRIISKRQQSTSLDSTCPTPASHVDANVPPKSILTRHEHLVLSILSKSFVAFSLECSVKQPGVIVRLNNVRNSSPDSLDNVDLKFGIGSCKLSFWNVFGGVPDGFSFPLKYDMQCRYLYIHSEKFSNTLEKQFEDIIEEPDWLLVCNGDIIVGRSLILPDTNSRASSSDMIDLLASNALSQKHIHRNNGAHTTIPAYHRVAVAVNMNIFVGELAVNCSRLSLSLISINYASVFEKLGSLVKHVQLLKNSSKARINQNHQFAQKKTRRSSILPMDINFSLAVVKNHQLA